MSEFLAFVQLGFRHIVAIDALDHILFLLVLGAVYRLSDGRDALWVISAFTVGHSVTLALAVTGAVRLPTPLIEFLIPVTILATGIENVALRDRQGSPWGGRYRAAFAALFGLVHGAGFANYLRSLFVDSVAVPLLGFNIGIELGQIVVLAAAACGFTILDAVLTAAPLPPRLPSPLRLRVLVISTSVAAVAAAWAVERRPW